MWIVKIMRYVTGVLLCLVGCTLYAQETDELRQELKALRTENGNLRHQNDKLMKKMDDVLWYNKVGDVAYIDKVFVCGPPVQTSRNPTEMGAKNPLKFWAYVFIPKTINTDKKYPLIVFAHSGVHSDFSTYYAHIVRELMTQGYIVVAAEYRGSTGYGKQTYDNIDYGGLENEDVYESRNHMIENYSFVDKNRIGIIGWSHGGMITLMNLFQHPDAYVCGFAGVPVSDIVMRMGYASDSYRKIFSDKNHIGKTGQRKFGGVQASFSRMACRKIKNTFVDSHEYKRRRCECAGSGTYDPGSESRGKEIRVSNIRRDSRRTLF